MRSSRVWMRFNRVWMRCSWVWMRCSRVWMRSSREWMRSSRMWMSLAECGWDLAELWMRSNRVWMRFSRMWMRCSWSWMRSSRVWMRSSRVWMRSSWVVLAVNVKVATVLVLTRASSDTVESERQQMKLCWITYIKKQTKSSLSSLSPANFFCKPVTFVNYLKKDLSGEWRKRLSAELLTVGEANKWSVNRKKTYVYTLAGKSDPDRNRLSLTAV